MIANAINIVLGLVLVYVAVLQPALLQGQLQEVIELLVGAAIVGLGFWERRSDYHPWHGHVIAVLGAAVILLELVGFGLSIPPLVYDWTFFWVGLLIAFLALWAALYRPQPSV